jgi:glutathione S-transferase
VRGQYATPHAIHIETLGDNRANGVYSLSGSAERGRPRPELGLAPTAGDHDRYRLQEWLSFVGTEIHKAFLFPTFWYANEAAKASARERIGKNLPVAAEHLESRQSVVGERFTVADAYLAWSLLLLKRGGVDVTEWPSLVGYLDHIRERPQVKAAIDAEQEIRKTLAV